MRLAMDFGRHNGTAQAWPFQEESEEDPEAWEGEGEEAHKEAEGFLRSESRRF